MDGWAQQSQQWGQEPQQPGTGWSAPPSPPPADGSGMPRALLVMIALLALLTAFGVGVFVATLPGEAREEVVMTGAVDADPGGAREVTVTVIETETATPVDPDSVVTRMAGEDGAAKVVTRDDAIIVGDYALWDLHTRCDSAGELTARGRITTMLGGDRANITLTFLRESGAVVGSVSGWVSGLTPEKDQIIEFFGTDECADFARIDVHMDYQF